MIKTKIFTIIIGVLALFACATAPVEEVTAKNVLVVEDGKTVKVHYTLTVDGDVIDSSSGKDPLSFIVGSGQVIPGFNNAVIGMKAGEKKSVTISPADGYGEINSAAIKEIPIESLPENITPAPGMTLYMKRPNGQSIPVKIIEVKDNAIVIDLNHPLAGKSLNFDMEIVEIL